MLEENGQLMLALHTVRIRFLLRLASGTFGKSDSNEKICLLHNTVIQNTIGWVLFAFVTTVRCRSVVQHVQKYRKFSMKWFFCVSLRLVGIVVIH
jgi:hypothetical protein